MSRPTRIRRSNRVLSSRRQFLRALGAAQLARASSLGGALLPLLTARAQPPAADITATDLGGGLWLLQGAGCNVLALHGDDGALMIDGGLAANVDALLRAVYATTRNDRVAMLINTHWHPEQTGANVVVGRAGGIILAHENTRMYLSNTVYSMTPDNALVRVEALPEAGRPREVTRGDGSLEFAGERIDYGYLPQAHTDGDLYVHFPEHNVLAAGGVVSGERWPLLDYRDGAWFGGRVRALEWLAELVAADTRVVPAEGREITGSELIRQRDIYLELFDTLIAYMNRGFGPEDAVEHNPLARYEPEFGDPSAFLYGAYRSMLIAYVPD
jgi:cyclase